MLHARTRRTAAMAGNDDDELERGRLLLLQLDRLLDADPFIDELGFVHPSEFESLRIASEHSIQETIKLEAGSTELHSQVPEKKVAAQGIDGQGDESLCRQKVNNVYYDNCVFWCHEHKLAIAAQAVFPVYKAAKEFLVAIQEGLLVHQKPESFKDVLTSSYESTRPVQDLGAVVEIDKHSENSRKNVHNQDYKQKLMSCTRVLVLINSDYASAWNARKRILLRESEENLMAELRLTKLVFSCAPKSEEAWVHRRWVIENLKQYPLDGVFEGDSKLVELIAERSPMNYRAWRHRCWLVPKMSLEQVLLELRHSKLWGASYVADNCCFHYRRCLLLHLLQIPLLTDDHREEGAVVRESNFNRSTQSTISPAMLPMIADLWKEELLWCADLLNTYLGLETLWTHRRFLILQLLEHKSLKCCTYRYKSASEKSGDKTEMDKLLSQNLVVLSEFHFIESCVSSCKSHSEEAQRQQEYANTYKLWILALVQRQVRLSEGQISGAFVQQLKDVKSFLGVICPQKQNLWDGLIPALLRPDIFAGQLS